MEKNQPNIFEVSVKGLKHPELFKKQAAKVASEISQKIGQGVDTKISLVPLSTHRGHYRLKITTEIDGEPLVVCRTGRRVHSLLRQAKRVILKVARRNQVKKVKKSRRKAQRWNLRSYEFIS